MFRRLNNLVVIGVFIIAWHIFSKCSSYIIPGPLQVLNAFTSALITKEPIMGRTLIEHAHMSIVRVISGSLLAFTIAISLGILLGCKKEICDSFNILIEMLRPIPPMAWVPISILLFRGQGPIFIVFLGVFFPCLICTLEGIKNVDREWVDLGKTLKASNFQIIAKIIIPASIPDILNGIRIGFGVGWMCIIAAEMIAFSSVGLGYYIMVMYEIGKIDYMLAGMFAIGILGYLINKFLCIVIKKYSYVR